MFATNFNCSSDIKNHFVLLILVFLVSYSAFYKSFDFSELLFLYKAVQKQSCIVFTIVWASTTESVIFIYWLLSQFSQVLDKIVKLRNLDELLYHIARVEMANSLNILVNCFCMIFLLIEFVTILFVDFSDNLVWEFRGLRDLLSFCIKTFFHQILDLNIVFHLVHFLQEHLATVVLYKQIHCVVFHFDMQYPRVHGVRPK